MRPLVQIQSPRPFILQKERFGLVFCGSVGLILFMSAVGSSIAFDAIPYAVRPMTFDIVISIRSCSYPEEEGDTIVLFPGVPRSVVGSSWRDLASQYAVRRSFIGRICAL